MGQNLPVASGVGPQRPEQYLVAEVATHDSLALVAHDGFRHAQ
jgi:hypothetical protein